MLRIDISINGKRVAGAKVENIRSLADLSDYLVTAVESGSDQTGHPEGWGTEFRVQNHNRRQSVWALVYAVAAKVMTQRKAERSLRRVG